MSMQVSPELEATDVLDLDGTPHPMKSLWSEKPTIVIWLRHYG